MATKKKTSKVTSKTTSKKPIATPKKTVRLFVDPTVPSNSNVLTSKNVTSDSNVSNVQNNKTISNNTTTSNAPINNTPKVEIKPSEPSINTQTSNNPVNQPQINNISQVNNVSSNIQPQNNVTNKPKNNNPIKPPKKKGFFSRLGFGEKLLFILFPIFTVAAISYVPLYTYVLNKTCTVTFNPKNDGEIVKKEVKNGDRVDKPTDPSLKDRVFMGWKKDTTKSDYYDFSSNVTNSFTLYGVWGFTVTFDSNYEGGGIHITDKAEDGGKVNKPSSPTRENCVFLDWYKDNTCKNIFDFDNDVIKANTTLYAKWRESYTYEVKFDLNDGSSEPYEVQTIVENGKVTRPINPSKQYNNFVNWYEDKECTIVYDFDTVYSGIRSGKTLYAKWSPVTYTANVFKSVDGNWTLDYKETISMPDKQRFNEPEAPIKEGYDFLGWFTNKECVGDPYDFNKDATGDVDLFPKFSSLKKCYVKIDYNYDGAPVDGATYYYGDKINVPNTIKRFGYYIYSWYTDKECEESFNFDNPIYENITLYAKWNIDELDSINIKSVAKESFGEDEVLNDNNYRVSCVFERGGDFDLPYKTETVDGYQVSSTDLTSFNGFPYTFVKADLDSNHTIEFSYTYNEKTVTTQTTLEAATHPLILKPYKDNTSNVDYSLLNISNIKLDGDPTLTPDICVTINSNRTLNSTSVVTLTNLKGQSLTDSTYLTLGYAAGSSVITINYKPSGRFVEGSAILTVKNTITYTTTTTLPIEFSSLDAFDKELDLYGNYNVKVKNASITKNKKYIDVKASVPRNIIENYQVGNDKILTTTPVKNIVQREDFAETTYLEFEELHILDNIESIGDNAFYRQGNLEKLIINDGLTYIGKYAFKHCTLLADVTLPSTLNYLGDGCFSGIHWHPIFGYLDLSLPNNLFYIGNNCFENSWFYTNLIVTIPSSCLHIGNNAFKGCGGSNIQINFASDAKTGWAVYDENSSRVKEINESELVDGEVTFNLLTHTTSHETTPGYANYAWQRTRSNSYSFNNFFL